VNAVWTAFQGRTVDLASQVYQGCQAGKETPEDREFQDAMGHQELQVLSVEWLCIVWTVKWSIMNRK